MSFGSSREAKHAMHRPSYILLLALVLVLSNCRSDYEDGGVLHSSDSAASGVPPDTVIVLERTPCYGDCPTYKLTISGDGLLIYEGRANVKTLGIVKSTVSQEQLRELIQEFERVDYFSLRDRYEGVDDGCSSWATDSPWAFTSISISGTSKRIEHYYGCMKKENTHRTEPPHFTELVYPEGLTMLESRIDEIVNSRQWTG